MVKSVLILLWLHVSALAYAQNPARHLTQQPTVEVTAPQHVYRMRIGSLRGVDFRNFHFHIFNEHGNSILTAKLRNGKYESVWTLRDGSNWLRPDWLRFMGEQSEFAIVSLSWVSTGGSASDFGVVQVFSLRSQHPVVVQQILFNTRGCNASSEFSSLYRVLTIKGVHGWEHCCPTTADVMQFRWTDGSFRMKSQHSVPLRQTC